MKHLYLIACLCVSAHMCCATAPYAGWAVGAVSNGYGTILYTDTTGDVWVRQGEGQLPNAAFTGVYAIDYMTAWVVGDEDDGYATIFFTEDAGATWQRKGHGQVALADIELGKVHAHNTHVWAVGKGALLYSPDAGATWTNAVPAAFSNVGFQAVYVVDETTVWVGGDGNVSEGDTFATILYSQDAGQSWTRQTNGGVREVDHVLGISAWDAQQAWAVGGDGFAVLRTYDGGDTWERMTNTTMGLGDANEVYVVTPDTIYTAVDNFIQWTHDGGETWQTKTTTYYTMGVCAVNTQMAWAVVSPPVGGGYIWHTADEGETWTEQFLEGGVRPVALWTISFATEPVPEPSVWGIMILGALAALRRR